MIDNENWLICKLCSLKICGGDGVYKSENFIKHIEKDHGLTTNEYFEKYCNFEKVKCPCKKCDKYLRIIRDGSKIRYQTIACGRNSGVLKWSEEAKISRKGKNNPAYGKKPWNKGLNKNNSEKMLEISEKQKGKIISEETRKKQSNSAKKRLFHGNTGNKHTEESKEKMRQKTLERIKSGCFKQTETKPVIIFKNILKELNIKFESEKILHYWSFDLYLPEYNIYIEIDGDYFHSNPKIYPNGPKTKTQKINFIRDIKKNNYCKLNKINLIRFWESDIINDEEKVKNEIRKNIIC